MSQRGDAWTLDERRGQRGERNVGEDQDPADAFDVRATRSGAMGEIPPPERDAVREARDGTPLVGLAPVEHANRQPRLDDRLGVLLAQWLAVVDDPRSERRVPAHARPVLVPGPPGGHRHRPMGRAARAGRTVRAGKSR
jgi:hypothetical protein